jgi:putative membrane protein
MNPLIKNAQKQSMSKVVAFCYSLFFIVGVVCLNFEKTRYLGLILAWAMPVILLQWFFGGNHLLTNSRIFLLSTFLPTFYLWVADGLALSWGIWSISETYTIGVSIGSLPFEEAVFFLVTNLMVSQGVILFVVMENEVAKVIDSLRRVLGLV